MATPPRIGRSLSTTIRRYGDVSGQDPRQTSGSRSLTEYVTVIPNVSTKLKTSGILPRRVQVRSCKYLNNVIEQDHRRIKQRIRPMLGFKRFETAAVTIQGNELAERIKKQQFNLKPLTGKATSAPDIWAAVLFRLESAKSSRQTKTYT
jgi:hypothetical protein